MQANDGFHCVVAEIEGRIVGSNCLDERSLIAGVGPITVDPGGQNSGVGRKLMQAAMDRANSRRSSSLRGAMGAPCKVRQTNSVTLITTSLKRQVWRSEN